MWKRESFRYLSNSRARRHLFMELCVNIVIFRSAFADACLVQMADELDTGDILTLDSDFIHYRWRKTRAFRMLISLV